MSKKAFPYRLMLPPRRKGELAYRWLCDALRTEILSRRLRSGARLPATRSISAQYGLARGTVVSAFDQLKSEGYLSGTIGSGTYVNEMLPDEFLTVAGKQRLSPATHHVARQVSAFGRRAHPMPGLEVKRTRAFRSNLPALDLFPTALWGQISGRLARRATARLLTGSSPLGYRPLQEAIADHLRTGRGVTCAPEQVAIVAGVQEALSLTSRVLLDPGDSVYVEDPTYPGATLQFEAAGVRVRALRVDDEGMLTPTARSRRVRLAYVTPAHQFPLGVSMSLPRRLALLEWARTTGAMIFEDDYDSEYRYTGRPLPALQGLDKNGVVLFAGSFSKVLFPSLRLGYLVLPTDLIDVFSAAKSLSSGHAPLLDQAVVSEFIAEGHFGRHMRRMREVYAERRSVLLEAAAEHLSGLLEIVGLDAGLQTAAWLSPGIDDELAAVAAAKRSVDVVPLSGFYRTQSTARSGFHLGFAAVDAREIRRGVRDLAAVLESLQASEPRPSGQNSEAHPRDRY